MSAIWREIHRIRDDDLAGFLAFTFTSLYQRVTRLSEFRFWGGSGNTARFNVPFIFNEANVFVTYERKARTIRDHLETTARSYRARAIVHTGSATDLRFLPDESIDLIFTDPPFGANINYSEMNILWESWLDTFTDNHFEAIVNRFQGKDLPRYRQIMTDSLKECYRVLRPRHWMVLVFMNSAEEVWQALRQSILEAGFTIERVDTFDKQHATFKQLVSDNTAGFDLMLHCHKTSASRKLSTPKPAENPTDVVRQCILNHLDNIPTQSYLHVKREAEIDYRLLYSQFLAVQITSNGRLMDFATFRRIASHIIEQHSAETDSK
jgi:hypothetical protein